MQSSRNSDSEVLSPSSRSWRGAVPPPVPERYRHRVHGPTSQPSQSASQHAPPVVTHPKPKKRRGPATRSSSTSIELEVHDQSHSDKSESRGWVSSVLLHALVLIIVALIVAPANLGKGEKHELVVSLGESGMGGPDMEFEVIDEDPGEQISEATLGGDQIVEVKVIKPIATSGGGSGKDQGPKGSFFGIVASGHTFVYVLDMSGSMKGRRYENACNELLRSVGGLDSTQKFYVILFSTGATQMFDQGSYVPKPLLATEANREKLERWLRGAFDGGWTDPREALKIALRMDPSAIFMLSDGEFKYGPKGKKSLIASGGDAFDVVRARRTNAPIHAIAFEDPGSCQNMRQVAQITGGKYRFVPANAKNTQDADVAKRMLATSRETIRSGNADQAKRQLTTLIEDLGQTNAAWDARLELSKLLMSELSGNDSIDSHLTTLTRIAGFDGQAVVTGEIQEQLVDRIFELCSHDPAAVPGVLDRLVDLFQSGNAPENVVSKISAELLSLARQDLARNRTSQAFEKLDRLVRRFGDSKAARAAKDQQSSLVGAMLSDAEQIRKSRGAVAYAKQLRAMMGQFPQTELANQAKEQLDSLRQSLVAQSSAARQRGDREAVREANETLEACFGGQVVSEMKQASSRDELRARSALKRVEKLAGTNISKARLIASYESVIRRYPATVASRTAAQRIESLESASSSGAMTLESLLENP